MGIKADLSHLPSPAKTTGEGLAPDANPRFASLLVEEWRSDHDDDKARAHDDARFRHSDAGKCARAIAYAALDVPREPMDLSGVWNVGLGSRVHEWWQDAVLRRWPDAEIETKVRTVGAPGAGHIDAVVRDGGRTIAVELKTIGGFGYKMAVGDRGAAQGPKEEHILQAALNAAAVDADEAVIVYLSKEAISVAAAQRKGFDELARFAAEWTLTREQYEPLARVEAERIAGILDLLDEGTLPLRRFPTAELPKGHEVQDASTGRWEVRGAEGEVLDFGTYFACGYCPYQQVCAQVGPGRVPVDTVVELTEQVA